MHPATRSAATNTVLDTLHPWFSGGYLLPGTTVQGCLACALSRIYNDGEAVRALAVLAKSAWRRGVGPAQLMREGWLGDVYGGAGGKLIGRQPPPVRPEPVKGMTLWGPGEEEQAKRWSGTTLGDGGGNSPKSPPPPRVPEKSRLRYHHQRRESSPLSPLSRRAEEGPTAKKGGKGYAAKNDGAQVPPIRRTKRESRIHTPPSPTNPFLDPSSKRPQYQNPFLDPYSYPSDEDEPVIAPSSTFNNDEYSDSDYGDDEEAAITRQRYLDEHDELLKLVGAPGWSRAKPRTREYLDTLPPMR
ncbi:MAG: hypothetical protein Q9219_004441 [cf. Caloplaca sp. 3 TL-2023]